MHPPPRAIWGYCRANTVRGGGTLTVNGARIASVTTPGFENYHTEKAKIDPRNPNQIKYYTRTRGREDVMLIELAGASGNTEFEIHLLSQNRNHDRISSRSADIKFRLGNMSDGRLEHELHEGDHTERFHQPGINQINFVDVRFKPALTSTN